MRNHSPLDSCHFQTLESLAPTFISPDLDDIANPMLNLLERKFLLGVALGIINSAILAHQG
jgi:hypothetical protein